MKTKILDCTLRDGGYYNNWSFDESLVQRYLHAMELCKIDFVELGFRLLSKDRFLGNFGKTSENYLEKIDLPSSIKYSVMVNCKEYVKDTSEIKSLINTQFTQSTSSPISLTRVAVNFDDALSSKEVLEELKKLGYQVGLNLMQSNGKKDEEYFNLASKINEWGLVDVLYFADSFGNMSPSDVKKINKVLSQEWKGEVGFHSHNNKGFALANALCAINEGIGWCDCTVMGMGRGAGNVTTESLLMELINLNLIDIDLSFLQGTLIDFEKLKKKYNWGPNLYYQFAANKNIHPTFVQSLLSDERYDEHQIFQCLENLSTRKSSSFSVEELRNSIYGNHENKTGSWDATGWLKGKEVLLVGGGPSVEKYKKEILSYVKKKTPEVVFININKFLPQEIGTATIVSHEIRAFLDSFLYKNLTHPLILPMKSLGKRISNHIQGLEILDYGLNLEKDAFIINSNFVTLGWPLSAAYALAICTQAQAKKIKLIGFDGYDSNDLRYEEMNNVIYKYQQLKNVAEIVALTPTRYNIKESLL